MAIVSLSKTKVIKKSFVIAQVRSPLPPLGKKKKLCFFFLTLLLRSEARAPTQVFCVLFINKGDIARGC